MLELLLGAVLGYALDMWGEVLDRQDAITLGKETLRRAQLDRSRSPKDRMFRLATRAVEVLQERSPDLCKLHPKMISVLSDPVFIEKIFDAILSPPDSPSGCKARQEAHGVLLAASIADGSPETVSTTTADYLALLDEVVTADEGLSRLRSERTGSQVLWSLASIEADLSEVLDNARLVPEIKTIVQELSGRQRRLVIWQRSSNRDPYPNPMSSSPDANTSSLPSHRNLLRAHWRGLL